MDTLSAWKSIYSLWSEEYLFDRFCCHCGDRILKGAAFARTVSLASPSTVSKGTSVSILSGDVNLYYRHLPCLLAHTQYVAISHVWDPDIAALQYKREELFSSAERVYKLLCDLPSRIFKALSTEFSAPLEIWHDYFSVPQWADSVKSQMLLQIPILYRHAKFTAAVLEDIDKSCFEAMRAGPSVTARCQGMGRICTASWFSRVWTALELANSPRLRFIVKDSQLVPMDGESTPLTHEIWRRWRDEVRINGSAKDLEATVKRTDGSLVPWQLGAIIPVRLDNLENRRTCFAVVHSILSKRHLTIQRDFLYALEGLLKTGNVIQPGDGAKHAMLDLAHSCLSAGDLSPLFMVPASAASGLATMDLGYADHATWGMGIEQCSPTFPETQKLDQPYAIIVQAEEIGDFRTAEFFDWKSNDQESTFAALCHMTLRTCGSDVDRFVATVGVRLYGQVANILEQRLKQGNRRDELTRRLQDLDYLAEQSDNRDTLAWIADVMGLSNTSLGDTHGDPQTPMTFLQHHGSTVHHDNQAAIVHIFCTQCRVTHLVRVAIFTNLGSLAGAKAYRIPGLKYRFSHIGGVGFLLQQDRMVGRFIWASATCDCVRLTAIKVVVDDLPMPESDYCGPAV